MTPEQVFSLANLIAVAAWLVLILLGRKYWVHAVVIGAIVPLLFAVLYTGLIIAHWAGAEGGFGTLAEVQALFSNEWLLLAGWVHYLAFDLFVGCWEVRDAQKHGIPHWAIVPNLILTFLFPPAGLLLYFVIRSLKDRKLSLYVSGQ
jgi:ABA4-like protein